MREDRNTADELAEAGRKGAKAAKTLARAGARAAGGDVAGAALEIIKDHDTVKVVLTVIVSFFVITGVLLVTALYIIPMMVYETVQNAVSDANDSFMESFFSSEEAGFKGQVHGAAKGIGSWIRTLAAGLKSQFSGLFSEQEQIYSAYDFDSIIANDSQIVSGEGAHVVSVWNKLSQIKAKYTARVAAIEKAITEKRADTAMKVETESYTGMTRDFLLQKSYKEFCKTYDPNWDILVSASWIPAYVVNELSSAQALEIAALYDVIHDNDFNAARMTDFLKWLGYSSSGNGDTLHFDVMGNDTELTGWTGTFLPQYLADESRINAGKSAEEAREKKLKDLEKLFFRIVEFAFTEERQSNILERTYSKAYRAVLDSYKEKYGVSLIDLLIYCYTGNLTQTEEPGKDDPDRNLLVLKGNSVVSSKEYGAGHPQYTFTGWRYANYGSDDRTDLLEEFMTRYGLDNYEFAEGSVSSDGRREGHIRLKTELKPKLYSRDISFSMWYDDYDDIWYYKYNESVYTTNPLCNDSSAAEKYWEQIQNLSSSFAFGSTIQVYASGWDSYPTVYEKIGSEFRPVPVSFTYTQNYTVMEPYVSAQFYKYYYRVSYFCPYYIACRSKSEILSIPGLLDGNYDQPRLNYLDQTADYHSSGVSTKEEGAS